MANYVRRLFPEGIRKRKNRELGYEADDDEDLNSNKRRKVYYEEKIGGPIAKFSRGVSVSNHSNNNSKHTPKSSYGRGNYTTYHSPSRSPSRSTAYKNIPQRIPASPGDSPRFSGYSPASPGYSPASPGYPGYSRALSSPPSSPRYSPASPTYSPERSCLSPELIDLTQDSD